MSLRDLGHSVSEWLASTGRAVMADIQVAMGENILDWPLWIIASICVITWLTLSFFKDDAIYSAELGRDFFDGIWPPIVTACAALYGMYYVTNHVGPEFQWLWYLSVWVLFCSLCVTFLRKTICPETGQAQDTEET